jgi:hypothetical protein
LEAPILLLEGTCDEIFEGAFEAGGRYVLDSSSSCIMLGRCDSWKPDGARDDGAAGVLEALILLEGILDARTFEGAFEAGRLEDSSGLFDILKYCNKLLEYSGC